MSPFKASSPTLEICSPNPKLNPSPRPQFPCHHHGEDPKMKGVCIRSVAEAAVLYDFLYACPTPPSRAFIAPKAIHSRPHGSAQTS